MDTASRRRNLAGFAGLLRQAGADVPDLVQQESLQRTGYADPPPPTALVPQKPRPRWPGFRGVAGPGADPQRQQRAFPVTNAPPGYGQ